MSDTLGTSVDETKPWQHGVPIERLRLLAQRFQQHDGDRCLGAFSRVKENSCAAWIAEQRLAEREDALVAFRILRASQSVSDWRQEEILRMPAGSLVIERAAGSARGIAEIASGLAAGAPILWRSWADHPEEAAAAELLGLRRSGSLIRSSSEILAVWQRGSVLLGSALPPEEMAGIIPAGIAPEPSLQLLAEAWIDQLDRLWIDHYSTYNKRRSWSALALRSFGGSQEFIEKPSEMSRSYRQEHPERLSWEIADTPMMDLPGARQILSDLGAPLERVRLMRLSGGGELSRHADITDRAAGCQVGRIARLHLPIKTFPSVRFSSWDLNNRPSDIHMTAGEWWYLDVRKPHRAINPSGLDRVHLVADCVVTPDLRDRLRSAAQGGI